MIIPESRNCINNEVTFWIQIFDCQSKTNLIIMLELKIWR